MFDVRSSRKQTFSDVDLRQQHRIVDLLSDLARTRKTSRVSLFYGLCQFNFTSIFPMFWPVNSPRKASGAFSMPRKTV